MNISVNNPPDCCTVIQGADAADRPAVAMIIR
jgi:hypothetical protein